MKSAPLMKSLLGCLVAVGCLGHVFGATPSPNVLVLIAEAQGWDSNSVGLDGPRSNSIARTPHLERLAREGVRFTGFLAASPRCTPTRAALLTGRSPAALRMTFVNEGRRDDVAPGTRVIPAASSNELPLSEVTLAELFHDNGYATAHFGKWHLGRTDPSRHGFDESTGPTSNGGPENSANPNPKQAFASADRAVDFIRRSVASGKPFYLQVAQYAGRSVIDARPETVAAIEKRLGNRGRFELGAAAVAEDADASYGMIFSALEKTGVWDNTIIVFTTDHGAQGMNPPFRGGKGQIAEGGLRVPLLIRAPGVRPGDAIPERCSSVDVFPTVAALAGIDCARLPGLEGSSLAPFLRQGPQASFQRPHPEFVVHFPHYDKDPAGPASALWLGSYKLVRRYETDARQLFRIDLDPAERTNLVSQFPEVAKDLDRRLSEYLTSVNAAMPRTNPRPDASRTAETLPGDRRGRRGGRNRTP